MSIAPESGDSASFKHRQTRAGAGSAIQCPTFAVTYLRPQIGLWFFPTYTMYDKVTLTRVLTRICYALRMEASNYGDSA